MCSSIQSPAKPRSKKQGDVLRGVREAAPSLAILSDTDDVPVDDAFLPQKINAGQDRCQHGGRGSIDYNRAYLESSKNSKSFSKAKGDDWVDSCSDESSNSNDEGDEELHLTLGDIKDTERILEDLAAQKAELGRQTDAL